MNTPPLYKKNRSFTIIELLVVFAIFGLIASVILVSMQAARDKARIAKALQFSATIYHSLGADMVGGWRFEEGTGSTVADSSNNGNTGTLCRGTAGVCISYGGADRWEKNSIHELGTAGKFNGTSDYVSVPKISIADKLTIESWVYFLGSGVSGIGWGGIVAQLNGVTSYNRLMLRVENAVLFQPFIGGVRFNHEFTLPKDQRNAWHHYVLVYDGSNVRLFWDGSEIQPNVGAGTQIGNLDSGTNNTWIGQGQSGTYFFKGNLDEVRIYTRALTASEIQKRYAEGAKKRGLAVEK